LIGSLGLRGLLAPLSIEGAVDTVVFDYVRHALVAQLRPKTLCCLITCLRKPVRLNKRLLRSKQKSCGCPLTRPTFAD
jgi:hypothetical protein